MAKVLLEPEKKAERAVLEAKPALTRSCPKATEAD